MLEFQLTPNSISSIHIWLIVLLGISFLLTVSFLLHFARFRPFTHAKYFLFSKLFLAVLTSLQIFAWQLFLYRDSHDTIALWGFPLAFIGGTFVWQLSSWSPVLHPQFARILPVFILLMSVAEVAGFAEVTRQFCDSAQIDQLDNPASDIASLGLLVENSTIFGSTDCGKPITLFERQVTTDAFRDFIEKTRAAFVNMSERAMLRAQPFVKSNCHGWVFTHGEHILMGKDVQLILEDNGYSEVLNPEANDIAVYRNREGEIVHTGVVRGSLEGTTMVESKWGIGGLYMHVAEEQPYSQDVKYYRTTRPTHDILVARRTPETSTNSALLSNQAINDGVKRSSFYAHLCSSQSK